MAHKLQSKADVRRLRARQAPVRRHVGAPRPEPPKAPGWNPAEFVQMHLAFAPARILGTALELDVFSHIAEGKRTAKELSATTGASERGTRMILDALVGMGMLIRHTDRYALAEPARRFFVRGKPDYMGDFISMNQLWEGWSHLTEIVRTGKPHAPVEQQAVAEEFFPKLIRGLHVVNMEPARRTAEALGVGAHRQAACGCWMSPAARASGASPWRKPIRMPT
jgi:hypothetical protein